MKMMKKMMIGLLAATAAATLSAQVSSIVKPVRTWDPKLFNFSVGADISNDTNRYLFQILQWKAKDGSPARNTLKLQQRTHGFCGDNPFLPLTVNGIQVKDIAIKPEHLTEWKEGDKAGCELKMNFSGVKLVYRLYMRPGSPVLWGVLKKMPDSVTPVKTAVVNFSVVPSRLAYKDGKVQWKSGTENYNREAVTPTRPLPGQNRRYTLTPEETIITFQDSVYDGSSAEKMKDRKDMLEKGMGPSAVILDHDAVAKAIVAVPPDYVSTLSVQLKPDFTEFHFGIYQLKERISNKDFAEKIKSDKDAFTLIK